MTTSGWKNWDFPNFVGKTDHKLWLKLFNENFSSVVGRSPSNLRVVSSNPPWSTNFFSIFFSFFLFQYFHNIIMCLMLIISCKNSHKLIIFIRAGYVCNDNFKRLKLLFLSWMSSKSKTETALKSEIWNTLSGLNDYSGAFRAPY